MESSLIQVLKIIVFSSILFVWVVRYQNIVEEFKFFGYPDWLRDFVGILKISFAIMLLSSETMIVKVGALGIACLMLLAVATHIKVKNPFPKMIPALILLALGIFFYAS